MPHPLMPSASSHWQHHVERADGIGSKVRGRQGAPPKRNCRRLGASGHNPKQQLVRSGSRAPQRRRPGSRRSDKAHSPSGSNAHNDDFGLDGWELALELVVIYLAGGEGQAGPSTEAGLEWRRQCRLHVRVVMMVVAARRFL
jgi:hypothetical protein